MTGLAGVEFQGLFHLVPLDGICLLLVSLRTITYHLNGLLLFATNVKLDGY